MWWCLDITLHNPPDTHLKWRMLAIARGGGVVGLRHTLMNKEWEYICGAAYTPAAVTNKPKINGVAAAGEAPTTGGRSNQRQITKGDTYRKEREVGDDLCGYMGVLGFLEPF